MSIAYAEWEKHRQALLQGLALELRQRLALRYMKPGEKMPLESQRNLAEALPAGLRRIPNAIAIGCSGL